MRNSLAAAFLALATLAPFAGAQDWGPWETIHGSGSGSEGRVEISFARNDCSDTPYANVPFRWNSTYAEPVRVTVSISFTRCKSDAGTQSFSATLPGGVTDLDGQYIGGLASVKEIRVTRVVYPNRQSTASAASSGASGSESRAEEPRAPSAAPRTAPAGGQQADASRAEADRVTRANADVTRRTAERIDGINRASGEFSAAVERAFGGTPEQRARQEAEDAREEAERARRRQAEEDADRRVADSIRRVENARQVNNARIAAANDSRLRERVALAESGRASAAQLVQLAQMYITGHEGIPVSVPAHQHYLRLALAKGSRDAEAYLAHSLLNDSGDSTEAIAIYTRRRSAGDRAAAYPLGRVAERRGRHREAIELYREAWPGFESDELAFRLGRALVEHGSSDGERREGVTFLRRSSTMGRGNADAKLYLAHLLVRGEVGVERDYRAADSLLTQASHATHYLRAEMRLRGQDTRFPRNVNAGIVFLESATDDSSRVVADRYAGVLARHYFEGWADTLNPTGGSRVVPGADPRYDGRRVTRYYGAPGTDVSYNQSKAVHWAQRGAAIGDTLATFILARLELEGARSTGGGPRGTSTIEAFPRNVPSGLSRLESLAGSGYEPARVLLAELHLEGRTVRRDPAMVQRLLAGASSPRARYLAGRAYEEGIGVPADAVKAVEAYTLAAEAREVDAMQRLAELYRRGRGVPADAALAKSWRERAEAFRVEITHAPLRQAR